MEYGVRKYGTYLCSNHVDPPVPHHQSPKSPQVPQVLEVTSPAEAAVEFLDLQAA